MMSITSATRGKEDEPLHYRATQFDKQRFITAHFASVNTHSVLQQLGRLMRGESVDRNEASILFPKVRWRRVHQRVVKSRICYQKEVVRLSVVTVRCSSTGVVGVVHDG
jgi:hypothetical protein